MDLLRIIFSFIFNNIASSQRSNIIEDHLKFLSEFTLLEPVSTPYLQIIISHSTTTFFISYNYKLATLLSRLLVFVNVILISLRWAILHFPK